MKMDHNGKSATMHWPKRTLHLLAFVGGVSSQASGAVMSTFHASPTGTGTECSTASPCSLLGVRDKIRLINSSMNGDLVVLLHGGTYPLSTGFALETKDGGTNGFSVIYQANPGESPVLSGGEKITGWSLHDANKNIYKAVVGTGSFRQLYAQGKRAIRSRTPNLVDPKTYGPYYTALGNNPYMVKSSEIGAWNNLNNVEFVWPAHWMHKRARLKSVTTSQNTSTLSFLSPENDQAVRDAFNQNDPISKAFYYWENAYELLDAAGEWYLDNGTLYYIPRPGEDMSKVEVIAPRAQTLVMATGVSNLVLKGLTFQHSNWTGPNTCGYLNWQSGLGNVPCNEDIPGMVQFKDSKNIRVEECVFEKSGAHGLLMNGTADHNSIVRNEFRNMSSGGIYVASDACGYLTITDNLVEGIGTDYRDACGILVTRPNHATIAYNEVRHTSYTGISVGWDWNSTDKGLNSNQIHHNLVHDFMEAQDDGGGIYTLGRMDSTNIHDNYIHSASMSPYAGGWGINSIYLDEGSANKTIERNVIANVGGGSIYVKGTNNVVRNNYYNLPNNGPGGTGIATENVYVSGENWPAQATAIMAAAGIRAKPSSGLDGPAHKASTSEISLQTTSTRSAVSYRIQLPRPGAFNLTVYSLSGRPLFVRNQSADVGNSTIVLDKNQLAPGSGMGIVKLSFEGQILTTKMML
jgi:hypothetical protein